MGYRLDGDLRTALLGVGERLLAILGGRCLLLVLVALGLVVGWLARRAIIRLARAVDFDRHTERLGFAISLNRAGILRTPSDVLGTVCFWAIFIFFARLGIDSLGFPGVDGGSAVLLPFLAAFSSASS